jgi:hypothetical protein
MHRDFRRTDEAEKMRNENDKHRWMHRSRFGNWKGNKNSSMKQESGNEDLKLVQLNCSVKCDQYWRSKQLQSNRHENELKSGK